jgi:hypothetical protein
MSDVLEFLNYENPNYDAIPDIPLYMDQLLDYLNTQMNPLLRKGEDGIFTKTMINNYAKSKVIEPPEKKKYKRSTIADLILVYHLKQCFSLQDTQALLEIFKEDASYYADFSQAQKDILDNIAQDYRHLLSTLENDEIKKVILSLTAEAAIKKKLAEQLLDAISR